MLAQNTNTLFEDTSAAPAIQPVDATPLAAETVDTASASNEPENESRIADFFKVSVLLAVFLFSLTVFDGQDRSFTGSAKIGSCSYSECGISQ